MKISIDLPLKDCITIFETEALATLLGRDITASEYVAERMKDASNRDLSCWTYMEIMSGPTSQRVRVPKLRQNHAEPDEDYFHRCQKVMHDLGAAMKKTPLPSAVTTKLCEGYAGVRDYFDMRLEQVHQAAEQRAAMATEESARQRKHLQDRAEARLLDESKRKQAQVNLTDQIDWDAVASRGVQNESI